MTQDTYRSRFRSRIIARTAEEKQEIRRAVTERLALTFGDRPSLPADSFLIGTGAWITGNGMPVDWRDPRDAPAWVSRIEKARQEIEEHKEHIKWREQCEAVHRAWPSESVSGLIEFIEGQYS